MNLQGEAATAEEAPRWTAVDFQAAAASSDGGTETAECIEEDARGGTDLPNGARGSGVRGK